MRNRSRGNEGVGQSDAAVYSDLSTIVDETRPGRHDRLTDRDRVCLAGQSKGSGSPLPDIGIVGREHTEFQLAQADHRDSDAVEKGAEGSGSLRRNEDPGVEQS